MKQKNQVGKNRGSHTEMGLKPGSTGRIPTLERESGEIENSEKDREGFRGGWQCEKCIHNNWEQQEGVKFPNVWILWRECDVIIIKWLQRGDAIS